MDNNLETCENCGNKIGRLESANLWQSRVVCDPCFIRLKQRNTPPLTRKITEWFRGLNRNPRLKWRLIYAAIIGITLIIPVSIFFMWTIFIHGANPNLSFAFDSEQDGVSTALTITNLDSNPVEIERVTYNGEYDASPSRMQGLFASSNHLPLVLTIGQSQEFAYKSKVSPKSYDKTIIFIDIETDHGDFRYSP